MKLTQKDENIINPSCIVPPIIFLSSEALTKYGIEHLNREYINPYKTIIFRFLDVFLWYISINSFRIPYPNIYGYST